MSPQTADLIAALQRAIAQSGVDLSGKEKAAEREHDGRVISAAFHRKRR